MWAYPRGFMRESRITTKTSTFQSVIWGLGLPHDFSQSRGCISRWRSVHRRPIDGPPPPIPKVVKILGLPLAPNSVTVIWKFSAEWTDGVG